MSLNLKTFNSPEEMYASIPKTLYENIEYRKVLHTMLDKDVGLQKLFLKMCLAEPKIWFNAVVFTCDPRQAPGLRNWPFILRQPKQEIVVDTLKYCIDNATTFKHLDIGINKSRDEGATELVTKFFALYSLIPDSYYIVGSRNKELVDCSGDPFTLFAKIDYAFNLPYAWFKPIQNSIQRKDMQLTLGYSGSVIKGETTNESFSAGRRATAMFLDEFGRVEPRPAKSIEGSIHDVTNCVIYGSTHWFGENHVFNKVLEKPSTTVVELPWYDNPVKAAGLYTSHDYNYVEILDRGYYESQYPEIDFPVGRFLYHEFRARCKDLDLQDMPIFVADGCERLPKDLRSPWHDAAEADRKGDRRDFMSNVWMSPIGASDSVFDTTILKSIKANCIRPYDHEGEIQFSLSPEGYIRKERWSKVGKCRMKWWGELENNRPDQDHNYVVGCDIALGTGNSNSTAAILDVNTRELVGMWACPNTTPENFADQVVAIARWCGGTSGEAYIIFENNGGHGVNFGRRIRWQGHTRLYIQRGEDKKTKKRMNKLGWGSNTNSKSDLFGELGIALSEGLKINSTYTSLKIHDEDLLSELFDYVYMDNGDIGTSETADITSGARKRHGDRVIAAGLCVLGGKYQGRGIREETEEIPTNTFKYLLEQEERKKQTLKHTMRRYLY